MVIELENNELYNNSFVNRVHEKIDYYITINNLSKNYTLIKKLFVSNKYNTEISINYVKQFEVKKLNFNLMQIDILHDQQKIAITFHEKHLQEKIINIPELMKFMEDSFNYYFASQTTFEYVRFKLTEDQLIPFLLEFDKAAKGIN